MCHKRTKRNPAGGHLHRKGALGILQQRTYDPTDEIAEQQQQRSQTNPAIQIADRVEIVFHVIDYTLPLHIGIIQPEQARHEGGILQKQLAVAPLCAPKIAQIGCACAASVVVRNPLQSEAIYQAAEILLIGRSERRQRIVGEFSPSLLDQRINPLLFLFGILRHELLVLPHR